MVAAVTAINVTAEHIANGVRGSGWGCAVALAIKDAFPGCEDVNVSEAAACICYEDVEPAWVDLPASAADFIEAFDNEWDVEPFTFTVDYPAVTS